MSAYEHVEAMHEHHSKETRSQSAVVSMDKTV